MARAAAGLGAPSLALIGHLESAEAYLELLSAARGDDLPPLRLSELEPLLRVMEPMPVCDVVLRSARGASARARYIDVGLLPESRIALRGAASRVERACEQAAAAGVRLAALGGFTSIALRPSGRGRGQVSGLALTTGSTLTAAVLAEQVRSAAGGLRGLHVTVVGAAGEVGSALCRLLHAGDARLSVVGRRRRPLQALARELPGARALEWEHAARRAEVVVLAASAPLASIALDAAPESALVLDAGHPPNASADRHVRYAVAGRVVHAVPPDPDLKALLARYGPGETHACLGEGIALALEERYEAYSGGGAERELGRRAREILEVAATHGITPAPLRIQEPHGALVGSGYESTRSSGGPTVRP